MTKSVEALVRPELLRWAREETSFSVAEAAQKADVREESLVEWESGQSRPSIPQLRRLANVYKRPLAVFYLSTPPPTMQPVRDFRRLPGDVAASASPALRLEIRKALRRREIGLEIFEDLGEEPPALRALVSADEDAEAVGALVRKLLEDPAAWQAKRRTDHEALNGWRGALEALGILVFQATGVALSEMLGFSISKNPLPVIVVNIKHHPRARIFTLMHEFVHLLLREGGVCDLREDASRPPENRAIEVFCNHAAGAALMPMDLLREHVGSQTPDEDLISRLAARYHIGREVVARRMLIGGMISGSFYQQMRGRFQSDFERTQAGKQDKEVIVQQHVKAVSVSGRLFTRLVLENYDENRITTNDVTDYLEVRPKYLPRIREVLRKGAEAMEEP